MRNQYGIRIKKCCASCRHKDATRLMTMRRCMEHDRDVKPGNTCSLWKMADHLKAAGSGLGCIKRKDYLRYVLEVRAEEAERADRGEQVVSKSIGEIRAAFTKEHGTIFINVLNN